MDRPHAASWDSESLPRRRRHSRHPRRGGRRSSPSSDDGTGTPRDNSIVTPNTEKLPSSQAVLPKEANAQSNEGSRTKVRDVLSIAIVPAARDRELIADFSRGQGGKDEGSGSIAQDEEAGTEEITEAAKGPAARDAGEEAEVGVEGELGAEGPAEGDGVNVAG